MNFDASQETQTRRAEKPDAASEGGGRNPPEAGDGASNVTARRDHCCPETVSMMEAVVERENMMAALRRVEANKGSAGIDDMPVEALRPYLKEQWPRIKEELLERSIHAASRAAGEDTQARRQGDASIGYPDGHGPAHPAGAASGDAADLRSGTFPNPAMAFVRAEALIRRYWQPVSM